MDIEALKTFITLADLKNFTKTAEQHFVVQSTVTNRINELEREIGKQLFERDKKHVVLTVEGEHLLSYARRIVELQETAAQELSLMSKYSGRLSIGTVNTVYDCHLAPLIAGYMKRYPDISVKVSVDHSNHLLRMLRDDIIDVCFSFIPIHSPQFLCQTFQTDTLILVTGKENNHYPEGLQAEELTSLTYLYCDYVTSEGKSILRNLFPKHYPFAFEVDNGTKLLPFLNQGIGYSFVPKSLVRKQLESGILVQVPMKDIELPLIESFVIINKKNEENQAIKNWLLLE